MSKRNIEENIFYKKIKNNKLIGVVNYFLKILGFIVLILILLEAFFYFNPIERSSFIEQDQIDNWKRVGYSYHPLLSYVIDSPHLERELDCVNDEGGEEIKINFYGGSTTMDGNPPISGRVFDSLCEAGFNVKVNNYGQLGYASTQEIFKFMLHLREGQRPDLVVFYDGANEENVNPQTSVSRDDTLMVLDHYFYNSQALFSNTANSLQTLFWDLGLLTFEDDGASRPLQEVDYLNYFYSDRHIDYETQREMDVDGRVEPYLVNVEIIEGLEDVFGFKSLFYWQPNLSLKENLTPKEKDIAKERGDMVERSYKFYQNTIDLIRESENVRDLTMIFEDIEDEIYTTDVHKTDLGYDKVAEIFTEDIINYLNQDE